MSEAYNPETNLYAELESLELEARRLAQRRAEAESDSDREAIDKQLKEVEGKIDLLKKRLKPG